VANGPASRNGISMTAVAKADLGAKRVCPSCAARFYDLQKRPIECPKCNFSFEPETMFKQRRPRQPEPEAVIAPVVAEEAEDENEETEEAEEAEAEELGVVEEPIVGISDDDDEEEEQVSEEEEAADAGLTVVADVEGADLEDLDEETADEDEPEEGLLEQVEEDSDDVVGIIDPGIAKDER
jgi:uncharacterized protein (TIGR02300 family)